MLRFAIFADIHGKFLLPFKRHYPIYAQNLAVFLNVFVINVYVIPTPPLPHHSPSPP